MKLLVCGGRDFRDRDLLFNCLDSAVLYGRCTEIICGYNPEDKRYQGADQLAYEWAVQFEHPCRTFPADWKRYGLSAGPRRNQQMADDKPDECLAFPRANGKWGDGTLNMIGKAAVAGAIIHRVTDAAGVKLPPQPDEAREGSHEQASDEVNGTTPNPSFSKAEGRTP